MEKIIKKRHINWEDLKKNAINFKSTSTVGTPSSTTTIGTTSSTTNIGTLSTTTSIIEDLSLRRKISAQSSTTMPFASQTNLGTTFPQLNLKNYIILLLLVVLIAGIIICYIFRNKFKKICSKDVERQMIEKQQTEDYNRRFPIRILEPPKESVDQISERNPASKLFSNEIPIVVSERVLGNEKNKWINNAIIFDYENQKRCSAFF